MKKIDKALNLNPLPMTMSDKQFISDERLETTTVDQSVTDLTYVRENLYEAITKSQAAVDEMLSIAQQSQHPKSYEVLNNIIKTYADISMNLAELHLKKQKLISPVQEESKVVNNNLFVGSTADFQLMIEKMKNNDNKS
jgi:hypothetical protein